MDPKDVILEKVHREGYVENTTKGCTEFGVISSGSFTILAMRSTSLLHAIVTLY